MGKLQNGKGRVFLDASVLFAAAISPSGGSFHCIHEAPRVGFLLVASPYAMEEAGDALRRKRPDRLSVLPELVVIGNIGRVADASTKFIERMTEYIVYKDAPVLAAAIHCRALILLTLDREHFFAPSVRHAPATPLILTPGDFIHEYLE